MCEILSIFPDTQMQHSTVTVPNSAENHWLSLLTHHAMVSMCVCVCVRACVFNQFSEFLDGYLGFQLPIGQQSAAMLKRLDPPTSWSYHLTWEEADHLPPFHSKVYNVWYLTPTQPVCIQSMLLELTQKHIIMLITFQLYTNVNNIAWLLETG